MYGQLGTSRYDVEISEEEDLLRLTKHNNDTRIKKIRFNMKKTQNTNDNWNDHWKIFEKYAADYYKNKKSGNANHSD